MFHFKITSPPTPGLFKCRVLIMTNLLSPWRVLCRPLCGRLRSQLPSLFSCGVCQGQGAQRDGCGSRPTVPFWGRCTTHLSQDFSGDWAVHWGYGILTHGHMTLRQEKRIPGGTGKLTPKRTSICFRFGFIFPCGLLNGNIVFPQGSQANGSWRYRQAHP